ncbi:Demethylmenaquinone methyltransferase [Pseudocercospora fuligena]|uniref:Demethylmenaquinone methyltransferase n=1 Tax=Pseudocercospora fuligena TaxID=685502 RepID=A0A8H6VG39_9PEZI|nr:Demethylmenaquinone methyltransferase [Pseudocercospora fuligena]
MAHHNQASDIGSVYDNRAESYDDSWHPRFARHMVEIAKLKPGEAVLDLACGTGLATLCASAAVQEHGSVVGIDISAGMLAQATQKLQHHNINNVELHQHSITDLDQLPELNGKQFDAILCCSALVLLQDPGAAIKQWATYLKPGGRIVVDVIHPQDQLPGITFERVGKRCNLPVPFYRLNFGGPEDLRQMCEQAGLTRVEILSVSQIDRPELNDLKDFLTDIDTPRPCREYDLKEAECIFDAHVDGPATRHLGRPQVREEAKKIFKDEWAKLADKQGKIKQVDCVFVAVASRP